MKWEILKGSEKDFASERDDVLVIHDLITGDVIAERRVSAWDGQGLPPVGSVVELNSEQYADYSWVKVQVVFEHNGELIVIVKMPDEPINDQMTKHSSGFDGVKFRTIRSTEDVARDKAIHAMASSHKPCGHATAGICADIYDAIAAGKVPGVKLE